MKKGIILQIVGIHGAFSSPCSLNYVKHFVGGEWLLVDYSNKIRGIPEIISFSNVLIQKPSIVIGHSLGGVIAVNLLKNPNVKKVITISSPLAGIVLPFYAYWGMTLVSFLAEISPYSPVIKKTLRIVNDHSNKIVSIVSTSGHNPFTIEKTDGVISIASQNVGPQKKHFVNSNHHEVLQISETVALINKELG